MTHRFAQGAVAVLSAAALVVLAADRTTPALRNAIDGPYARMLAAAADLGPARSSRVKLTAMLREPSAPVQLDRWGHAVGLSVRWRPGDNWAVIEGSPQSVGAAFGVALRDYRIRGGPEAGQDPHRPDRRRPCPCLRQDGILSRVGGL